MSEEGYSTVIDALLFLAFISACVAILGPVISAGTQERASADRGLRELTADTLLALKTEKVDLLEYRILGKEADQIACLGGINASNDILYRDITNALLGRGSRHKTVLELAAEDAACQFIAGGPPGIRLNPLTADYDRATGDLINCTIRSYLDQRYSYEFTVRWSPLVGASLYGEVRSGRPHPPGALSSSTAATMPYTTNITAKAIEDACSGDLGLIDESVAALKDNPGSCQARIEIRQALEGCLRNTTRLIVGEIWNNTLGSQNALSSPINPIKILKRFSHNETLNREIGAQIGSLGEGEIEELLVRENAAEMDRLAEEIADGAEEGRGARQATVSWLGSRYKPSQAIATLSVWVEPHD